MLEAGGAGGGAIHPVIILSKLAASCSNRSHSGASAPYTTVWPESTPQKRGAFVKCALQGEHVNSVGRGGGGEA